MKIDLENKIKFDFSKLEKQLVDEITAKNGILSDIRSRHKAQYDKGKTPGGKQQRRYSASYRDAIKEGRVDGKPPDSAYTVNLRQSGALHSSIQIVERADGGELVFQGKHASNFKIKSRKPGKKPKKKKEMTNEQLARELKDKGFKLHELTEKDKKFAMNRLKKILKVGLRGIVTKK